MQPSNLELRHILEQFPAPSETRPALPPACRDRSRGGHTKSARLLSLGQVESQQSLPEARQPSQRDLPMRYQDLHEHPMKPDRAQQLCGMFRSIQVTCLTVPALGQERSKREDRMDGARPLFQMLLQLP